MDGKMGPRGSFGHVEGVEVYEFDNEKAKSTCRK
jgi:hypothetical protein